ncbi:LacI family transcriptional regulator [Panacibacter ginsenosidivorans]|uniref:LacI family transcriptional regulator n=1 Tax=Panacibacter ginsenosidivorans TaxID=1813871 RepID=A0A5B8VB30_9BACT|nr:LacI family DNA-binding transcriptional regulator [Panacibacter ginsenosidivorans]QEC68183.1 LacI family transcriptional regulator [Panacibacter ginsenosidivorans]
MRSKQPTIKEIAKRLNISVSTVSRALHDHSSIGLRTKTQVKQLAKELNYEPNQTAIFFQQRKTFTIGVILPHLAESFFSEAISGIEDVTYKNKYTVLLGQSHDDVEKEKQLVEKMKIHRVDGMLISISKNTATYEHFEMLKKANIPVVFFDRIPKVQDIHYVACNMISGTMQAVKFLLEKGHRVIGLLNGPENLFACKERQEGYVQALIKNRIKFDPSLVVNTDLSPEGNIKATKELLAHKRKVTAIVVFNDYVAMDAMHYAHQQKIKINKDVCFVSYANLPFTHYLKYCPMASVEQYPYKQGQKATEMLLELLDKNEEEAAPTNYKIILDSQLVVYNG